MYTESSPVRSISPAVVALARHPAFAHFTPMVFDEIDVGTLPAPQAAIIERIRSEIVWKGTAELGSILYTLSYSGRPLVKRQTTDEMSGLTCVGRDSKLNLGVTDEVAEKLHDILSSLAPWNTEANAPVYPRVIGMPTDQLPRWERSLLDTRLRNHRFSPTYRIPFSYWSRRLQLPSLDPFGYATEVQCSVERIPLLDLILEVSETIGRYKGTKVAKHLSESGFNVDKFANEVRE